MTFFLEFDIFKPWLESGIFKCISWLNISVFGSYISSLKEGIKTYLMTPMSPLYTTSFFCPRIYSLCFLVVNEANSPRRYQEHTALGHHYVGMVSHSQHFLPQITKWLIINAWIHSVQYCVLRKDQRKKIMYSWISRTDDKDGLLT
jgi:hypothetical protein